MSTFDGLPIHVLLVHGIIVLVPLTAALLILCALWPAARSRFLWLAVGLAVVVLALTPLTTEAGEWLRDRIGTTTPEIERHVQLGDQMLYYVVPLVVSAALLVVVRQREIRGRALGKVAVAAIAVLVLATGVTSTVHTYRVGESGSRAVWGGLTDG
ncbi:hypothetical protein JK358_31605 [Nocardia sp. 2]|uniref:DUF2231 domain-containing protein n=1 Tax=Nocardia acididurans TaxID=2802282 RepID=A0ABS1MFY5_9NOCA|nr:DUF2231 domain-containing protein [Nocardia acididurans]MBL1078960.1 hypothetical protein [Nocardia acididurans]